MSRKAKIVATIGPASQDQSILSQLIQAGVDVVRLNFSHGSYQSHLSVINAIRNLEKEYNRSITILQDIQGPKIRVGAIPQSGITLTPGDRIQIIPQKKSEEPNKIPIEYAGLFKLIRPGDKILLDDGNIELLALKVNGVIDAQIMVGGLLKSHKGVNFPGKTLNLPCLTPKDIEDIVFGLEQGIDVIAISFVKEAEDLITVRKLITEKYAQRSRIPLIAKLERPEALQNLEDILEVADGVMIARGDLGVELPPELVPIAQKRIIEQANRQGKIVITATQMLDSMIHKPRPTRAEATDVANAIFDGTDAVMLSGETAIGEYPVLAVRTMDKIILEAEKNMKTWGREILRVSSVSDDDDAFYITQASYALARDRSVAAIAVFTKSGRTALLMSKTRPVVDILAFTSIPEVYHYMNLFWGTNTFLVPYANDLEEMLIVVNSKILQSTQVKAGQQVVLVCGYPVQATVPANLTLLHTIRV